MTSKTIVINPARTISGSVRLPGDKSISHRYTMLAALAEGTSRLENFSTAADCASTVACMEALGARVERTEGKLEITGGTLAASAAPLECGNSGSTMRMMAGILAGQDFVSELVGDASLSRRPMGRIAEPLRRMGATVESSDGERAPLRIRGGQLRAIDLEMKVASAQVKTCVLFAALFAKGVTSVAEPLLTRDHGELALRAFGAELQREHNRVSIPGGQHLRAIDAYIPGDISSAAFFMCAAMLFSDANLVLDNVLLNPTRAVLLDVLAAMGARISFLRVEEQHGETVGTIRLQPPARLRGTTIAGARAAALIDELPVLAAIAPFTEDGIEIRDARELRVKESDRIASVASNLRAMGAHVEEKDDGLQVPGRQQVHGAELESFGDQRIAMAFSVAALRAGQSVIRGADAAAVSYPEFFQVLDSLAQR